MKKYLLIFWLLVCAPFGVFSQTGDYFIPIGDVSGSGTAQDHTELEAASQEILLSLADTVLRSQFRVYDFGFYIHNEVTAEGVQEAWTKAVDSVENSQTSNFYYILFGRESNSSGINKKIRVKLRLPTDARYSCLSESERMGLERLMGEVAGEHLHEGYVKAEIEALKILKDYIHKVIVCNCANTGPECNQFSGFQYIDLELRGLGFRKKQIELGAPASWPNGTLGIYDHVGAKVIIDGEEYYIPEEVEESKAIFDSPTQVLEDTVISTSITGEVYILNNESFTNGEWENAVAQSSTVDYVEYWVVLTDDEGNTFLYSKYTLGALEDVPAARDENGRPSVAISPWGAALKVLGNAAVDACMQAVVIRILDSKVNSWPAAWKEVSYLGAAWEGLGSLLPWKKASTVVTILKIATRGFVVVLDNALKKPDYTVSQGVTDFIISCGTDLFVELIKHPKVANYIHGPIGPLKLKYSDKLLRIFNDSSTKKLMKKVIAKATRVLCYGIKREVSDFVVSATQDKLVAGIGKKLIGNIYETTTLLGRWDPDMEKIIGKMLPHEFNIELPNFGLAGPLNGGFNFLNIQPSTLWNWPDINKVWLKMAISRGDDVFLVTMHGKIEDIIENNILKGAYAKELAVLVFHNYKPKNISDAYWGKIKSWINTLPQDYYLEIVD